MPRATNSPASRERKRKMQKLAKGFFGLRRNGNRNMQETVVRGLVYQYRDRRNKKRSFRALWITRIHIAANEAGISYNAFISGLAKAGVTLNRKVLANLAATEPKAFAELVKVAKEA
ncbi:50S ribosomal protein L20 [bacterium]|jgi:ribosomal protein L20|nr:50S ribosomal protein L20 [bacterium]MBO7434931.1 50S ribosomal protein L20 [bacterium]MBO7448279.1 50S ribosomal protein L20 [bacterium]MBO7542827.1 50S ribosomal protein L20 [bacterium]MBP5628079.1 50S ribosomal protein L20 [bacterium]